MSGKMIEINLLPSDVREKMEPASKKLGLDLPNFVPLAMVGVIIVLVLVNMYSYSGKNRAVNALAEKKQEVKTTKEHAEQARKLEEDLPTTREQAEYLRQKIGAKLAVWQVLQQVSLACPDQVKVRDLQVGSTQSGNLVVVEGNYRSETGVYLEEEFRTKLEQSEILSKYFNRFRAERTVGADGFTTFTIIGSTQ